ncbi:hypothetical protein BKA67DRAFT_537410 [Truncatella angustata]|uniref:ABM domain-containing protein n=1 Tax=Truncatella angustata TaxID=152316 RepID=A0A9P8UG91_9PEZI|nr:uncharacterized protein BKA67DRAFT_537410 [Truncatella angustata]KAH6651544.1 hypothetical protein BKA67DRAFT_537410 [Truncatella angustata]
MTMVPHQPICEVTFPQSCEISASNNITQDSGDTLHSRESITLHQQLDRRVTFAEQLAQSPPVGPIVLMNVISIPDGADYDSFLDTWRQSGDILKKQPGYISTQLHRSLDGHFLVNYAVWETNEDLKKGLELAEFKDILATLPDGTVFKPTVMRKIAVAGSCVA